MSFRAATVTLPFAAELSPILLCEKAPTKVFSKHFVFLVPGSGCVASHNVVVVSSKADCTDCKEGKCKLGVKGVGAFE